MADTEAALIAGLDLLIREAGGRGDPPPVLISDAIFPAAPPLAVRDGRQLYVLAGPLFWQGIPRQIGGSYVIDTAERRGESYRGLPVRRLGAGELSSEQVLGMARGIATGWGLLQPYSLDAGPLFG